MVCLTGHGGKKVCFLLVKIIRTNTSLKWFSSNFHISLVRNSILNIKNGKEILHITDVF